MTVFFAGGKWLGVPKKTLLTVALTIAFVLTFALGGVADDFWQTIRINTNPMTISVDGTNLVSDPAPFTYNDRTFVPLRFISEALGARVTWDSASRTVKIEGSGKYIPFPQAMPPKGETLAWENLGAPDAYLSKVPPADVESSTFTVMGVSNIMLGPARPVSDPYYIYAMGGHMNGDTGGSSPEDPWWAVWNISEAYNRLTTVAYLASDSLADATLTVEADGKVLARITAEPNVPQMVDVHVGGARKITIRATRGAWYFIEPKLYK